MTRCLVLLALSACVSGCANAGDTRIDVVFDPCVTAVVARGATQEELASVDRALALWNEAAGLVLVRAAESASPTTIEIRFVRSLPAFLGVYDDEVGEIMVNRNIEDAERRTLAIAHELGHAFGLLHVPVDARASLMNPGHVRVPPTAADVGELYTIWGDCRGTESSNE